MATGTNPPKNPMTQYIFFYYDESRASTFGPSLVKGQGRTKKAAMIDAANRHFRNPDEEEIEDFMENALPLATVTGLGAEIRLSQKNIGEIFGTTF